MAVHSVGVVGSGQMGNGIAQVAACSGKEVIMVDIKEEFLERGVSTISNSLENQRSPCLPDKLGPLLPAGATRPATSA